ncbi:MAG: hypothetical protein P4L72_13035 [Parvibaculum sp.]|uniref:hypothetical protein n=1 Tax=Parvibaculum sp. TaxID=2024848 RepID=UPI00283FF1BC|nr:hypothetical protein [Parvibaculum sp.]MDR3500138.1 hypothetical protein [Parvibaculum sp.]
MAAVFLRSAASFAAAAFETTLFEGAFAFPAGLTDLDALADFATLAGLAGLAALDGLVTLPGLTGLADLAAFGFALAAVAVFARGRWTFGSFG